MSCYKVDTYSPVYYARFKTLTCGRGRGLVYTNSYRCKNTHKHTHTVWVDWSLETHLLSGAPWPELQLASYTSSPLCVCVTPPVSFCNDSVLGRDLRCQKVNPQYSGITFLTFTSYFWTAGYIFISLSVSGRPAFDLILVGTTVSGVRIVLLSLTERG